LRTSGAVTLAGTDRHQLKPADDRLEKAFVR
jgi:hypothetical protein